MNDCDGLQYRILVCLVNAAKKIAVNRISARRRTNRFIDKVRRPAYLSAALEGTRGVRPGADFCVLAFRAGRLSPRDARAEKPAADREGL